jgi:hypothetical protein
MPHHTQLSTAPTPSTPTQRYSPLSNGFTPALSLLDSTTHAVPRPPFRVLSAPNPIPFNGNVESAPPLTLTDRKVLVDDLIVTTRPVPLPLVTATFLTMFWPYAPITLEQGSCPRYRPLPLHHPCRTTCSSTSRRGHPHPVPRPHALPRPGPRIPGSCSPPTPSSIADTHALALSFPHLLPRRHALPRPLTQPFSLSHTPSSAKGSPFAYPRNSTSSSVTLLPRMCPLAHEFLP